MHIAASARHAKYLEAINFASAQTGISIWPIQLNQKWHSSFARGMALNHPNEQTCPIFTSNSKFQATKCKIESEWETHTFLIYNLISIGAVIVAANDVIHQRENEKLEKSSSSSSANLTDRNHSIPIWTMNVSMCWRNAAPSISLGAH